MSNKQEVLANSFTTLNNFEEEANRKGKIGWKLFYFNINISSGYPITAVWVKNYKSETDAYGNIRTTEVD